MSSRAQFYAQVSRYFYLEAYSALSELLGQATISFSQTMKSVFSLLAIALVAVSCRRTDDDSIAPQVVEDPTWIKLTVPSEISTDDQAYAVAGDLDKTLLVATKTTVFTTSDKGQTWQKSHNFGGPVPYLLQSNDTIFAFRFSRGNAIYGERQAFEVHYFTADFGQTWLPTSRLPNVVRYLDMVQPTGRIQAAGGTYFLQGNSTAIPNSSDQLLLATDLYRTSASGPALVRLPGRHYLNNLHFDAQHRLYVAASGLAFDSVTHQAIDPTLNRQGLSTSRVNRFLSNSQPRGLSCANVSVYT